MLWFLFFCRGDNFQLRTALACALWFFFLFRGCWFQLRSALAFLLWFSFCSVVATFSFYSPVRAALTFVGCDKSKQKRAFVPPSFYEQVRSGGEFFCYYLCLKLSFVQFFLIVIETTLYSTEKFTLLLVCPTETAHEPL